MIIAPVSICKFSFGLYNKHNPINKNGIAIERYLTIAPELLTINPIKNKILKENNMQNKA